MNTSQSTTNSSVASLTNASEINNQATVESAVQSSSAAKSTAELSNDKATVQTTSVQNAVPSEKTGSPCCGCCDPNAPRA
ncbi:hypothetical protein [Undibacterium macrobrachii]|jgi:hypothetical protein|uniref:Uncharacterized protein n=1 Tax=Undibacterium macrobrachii TaxID=1119058 RepID=A0ABQ2XNK4_9BURK|nr:hypothetical protein [Undibacterium macrobrachii]GGX24523.1 hypothetical protein GCM10011282_33140 [Undibacterium macrobrachii]